ncbi:MAG TPA: DUF4382 domain-containing protein [Bacteroidota bacterium]|nr:DUF4382 domain-containing protein [Bacteroidota bacterium]
MKNFVVLGLILITIVSFSSCNRETTNQPEDGMGMLEIRMIDMPASYDEVNIVIDSVQAHIATSDSMSGWYTLNRIPATYNLLMLVNGANAVIGSTQLPVGRYSQIRLFIGEGSNVVVDGDSVPLTTPSGMQSGIKLNVDAVIEPDILYTLTLDFDANRSIVKTGSPTNPKYILKPVIRTVATGTTGIISGVISPSATRPSVWAFTATDTASTFADTSGGFKLVYLNPNTYSVYITPSDTAFQDTTILNVSVSASATTYLDTIILQPK